MRKSLFTAAVLLTASMMAFATSKVVDMGTGAAGTIESQIPAGERDALTELTVKGEINAVDFKFLRDELPALEILDIKEVDIVAFSGKGGTDPYESEGDVDYGAHAIPSRAFNSNRTITEIAFPRTLKYIQSEAFGSTVPLVVADFSDTQLEKIEGYAFYYSYTLESVIIPATMIYISDGAFMGADALTSFTSLAADPDDIREGVRSMFGADYDYENGIETELLPPAGCTLYVPEGSVDLYQVADTWELFSNIEVISGGSDNTDPKIPAEPKVTELTIDMTGKAGTLATEIPADYLSSIKTLIISGDLNAVDFKFIGSELTALEKLNIADVHIEAYEGTEGTHYSAGYKYAYPENVFPHSGFYYKGEKLKEVVFPKSMTEVDTYAFMYHSKLQVADFSNCQNLTTIKSSVFSRCTSLNKIVLPASITKLEDRAFTEIGNVTFVCYATVPSLIEAEGMIGPGWDGTDYVPVTELPNATLYVPASAKAAYESMLPWSMFGAILPIDETVEPTMIVDGGTTIALSAANLAGRTSVTISGDKITADDFALLNAATDLLSIDLTGVKSIAGTFAPANPNCLLYAAWDANIAGNNIVKGTLAGNVVLDDDYPFNCPKAFRAANLVYTRAFPAAGWASLCLPFNLAELPQGIAVEEFESAEGSVVNFTAVTEITANTPYIANVTGNLAKEFAATNAYVFASSLRDLTRGDFTFKGTYAPIAAPNAEGLYMLTITGNGFGEGTNQADVPAFRAYIEYTGEGVAPAKQITFGEGGNPTGFEAPDAIRELSIYCNGDVIEIYADKAQTIALYGIDGRIVRLVALQEGSNTIADLASGLYLIANQKVAIK